MVSTKPRIYTLGYEDKTLPEILTELTQNDVQRVIDIRAVNESTHEAFNGPPLADALSEHGIAYHHIGQLGDFQPQPYPQYMETPTWQDAFESLLDTLDNDNTALLCTCANVATCHRRYLAQRLRDADHAVIHLTPAGPKQSTAFEPDPS